MKSSKQSCAVRLTAAGLALWTAVVLVLCGCVGWSTNLYWLIAECIAYGAGTNIARVILAAVGVFVPPIGALHGIVSWFV